MGKLFSVYGSQIFTDWKLACYFVETSTQVTVTSSVKLNQNNAKMLQTIHKLVIICFYEHYSFLIVFEVKSYFVYLKPIHFFKRLLQYEMSFRSFFFFLFSFSFFPHLISFSVSTKLPFRNPFHFLFFLKPLRLFFFHTISTFRLGGQICKCDTLRLLETPFEAINPAHCDTKRTKLRH